MPFLGKLRKLLIQHDNSGGNPAWHLFKVDVTCNKDKQVWGCDCVCMGGVSATRTMQM